MIKVKKLLTNNAILTFLAMIIGAILGLVFGEKMTQFKFIGDVWLNCIKMIIVPLVFCVMVTAIGGQRDAKSLGRVAVRIMGYYLITTIIAAIIGATLGLIIKPGETASITGLTSKEITSTTEISIVTFFTSLFSDNMFGSFSDGNILQTMSIAILLGIAILRMKNEEYKETILKVFQSANDMVFSYINMIIKFAPIGVLFLIADSFGAYGYSILTSMAGLIGTFWLGVILQVFLVYGIVIWLSTRMNIFKFLKKSAPVWTFTLASCSSSANIPIGIRVAQEEFDVPENIAKFGIPLGAQMNYDASAILYPIVLLFISQFYGIPVEVGTMIQMIFVAVLLASSGGGIPGSGIVKMLVIVQTFGLPVEIVGVIAGFYRFIDMGTTTGNCLGDLAGTVFVTRWEERSLAKKKAKAIKA